MHSLLTISIRNGPPTENKSELLTSEAGYTFRSRREYAFSAGVAGSTAKGLTVGPKRVRRELLIQLTAPTNP